jgi:hypothetical protein
MSISSWVGSSHTPVGRFRNQRQNYVVEAQVVVVALHNEGRTTFGTARVGERQLGNHNVATAAIHGYFRCAS